MIKYALSYIKIHLNVSVTFATIIRLLYKNIGKIQQLPKMHKQNHLILNVEQIKFVNA